METNESIDIQIGCDVKSSVTPIESKNDELKAETEVEPTEEAKEETTDAFQYTRRGPFTSETHKIEVKNLPKHIGYDTFKKLMKKLELNPLKIKLIGPGGNHSHGFVTFRCDEDRDKAIERLDKYLWKNKELVVRKANPIPDPLVEKRKESLESDHKCDLKRTKSEDLSGLTDEQLADKLNDKVASLWKIPYPQQLDEKGIHVKSFVDKFQRQVVANAGDKRDLFKPCLLDKIKVSPVVDGYRNKCEFTVGIDKTVGFRLGLYKEGTVRVITPGLNCPIIGQRMRKALNAFQRYITTESKLEGFNPETHSGHWIQYTVRTTGCDSMVIMALHRQQLTDSDVAQEKQNIITFFDTHPEFEVNSVYIHISNNRHNFSNENLEYLFGEKYIYETIAMDRDLKFRISPLAFFQINSIGAQICFQSIEDLIKPNPELTLLDICCGTGTIGLCLASKVKKVIGIELNVDAISDAKVNAQLNGISNVEYHAGKAEEVITKVLDTCYTDDSDMVAVIDPPRAGLNNSLIRALRSNHLLKRLVYVSCDPNMAIKNMVDLCRPTSKSYRGKPFAAIRAIPVDLFPHTNRCELVVLFERVGE